jgi:hypothetical protein
MPHPTLQHYIYFEYDFSAIQIFKFQILILRTNQITNKVYLITRVFKVRVHLY